MTDPQMTAGRQLPWHALALGLVAAIGALLLYRPWIPRPFDIFDFSEFLPLLIGADGPVERYRGFVRFYVEEHGRFNLVSYAALITKWELFGTHVAWWQWARFAQLSLLVVGVYHLLRRLNATLIGASAGASLFLVARTSGEAWSRLTLAEPLGIIFVLGALLLAAGWRTDPSIRRGVGIGALLVLAILAKEMLAGLAPLVWVVGACRDEEGRLGVPPARSNALALVGWVGIPTVLSFGAAAGVALLSQGEGFTTMYGTVPPTFGAFLESWQRPWQIQGQTPAPRSWLLPANTLLGLVCLAGATAAWRSDAPMRRHMTWMAGMALLLTGTYAVLYLPWPLFNLYYAMPFLLGPALLLATSVSAVERRAPRALAAVIVVWLAMVGAAATSTARTTWSAIAIQQTHGEVIGALAAHPDADTIIVARRQVATLSWVGTGASLRAFALTTGGADSLPPAVDRTCAEVGELIRTGTDRRVIVSYLHGCGALPITPSRSFRRTTPFVVIRWSGIDTGRDTTGADLLIPER